MQICLNKLIKMKRQQKEGNIRFFNQLVNVHLRGFINSLYDSNLAITRTSAGIKIIIAYRKDCALTLDPRNRLNDKHNFP